MTANEHYVIFKENDLMFNDNYVIVHENDIITANLRSAFRQNGLHLLLRMDCKPAKLLAWRGRNKEEKIQENPEEKRHQEV